MNVSPKALCSAILTMFLALLSVNQLPVATAAAGEPQVLGKSELVLESGDRTFLFEVEVAAGAEERRVGLMHRREMAPDAGHAV